MSVLNLGRTQSTGSPPAGSLGSYERKRKVSVLCTWNREVREVTGKDDFLTSYTYLTTQETSF